MTPTLQVQSGYVAALAAAIVFDIVFPVALALIVRRRFHIAWRYFLYGALIFFLFQLITRVPAVTVIQTLIQPQLLASRALQLIWLLILVVTAGLFEEVGRYIGYRWLMRREDKTWGKALMYGLGHGGLESILLVGGLSLLTLVNLLVLPTVSLTPAQRALAEQQIAGINALPAWIPLLGAYERLWTVPIQVAFSVMVLQVFRRGTLVWLWLAILAHALVDFAAVGVTQFVTLSGMARLLVPEAILTVFGLLAVLTIWKLYEPPRAEAAPTGE
jgi:uncharacterized membrane protein YhfC